MEQKVKHSKMRRISIRAGILLLLGLAAIQGPAYSQIVYMDFLNGSIEDSKILLQEFMRPYSHILGSDLNAGWYNTARPHELGGLDVTATVSWAKAPASDLRYDMSQLELHGNADLSNTSFTPTIAGSQEVRPGMSYTQSVDVGGGNMQEVEYSNYTLPDGKGVDYYPLPMIQLTVGLPFGTDVSARFVPNVGYMDYGDLGLWGVGAKHSLTQWIPAMESLPFLDVSAQGGYTKVTSSMHVLVEPQSLVEVDNYPDYDWDDQFVTQLVEGWTVNLIASQTFGMLTLYQGIGYASSMVELKLEGHYPIHTVISDTGSPDYGSTTYEIQENPINMKYSNFQNMRYNVGARIKLGVLTLHYDFTHTYYITHSVGLGVSFR